MDYDKSLFATVTVVVLCMAALASFIHVFGYLANRFAWFGDGLVPLIVFLVAYMWALTALARAAGRYIEEAWWQAGKTGRVGHTQFVRAQVIMTLGLVLCALLAGSALFVYYAQALPKLLCYLCALAASVFLILWPCAQLRRASRR